MVECRIEMKFIPVSCKHHLSQGIYPIVSHATLLLRNTDYMAIHTFVTERLY